MSIKVTKSKRPSKFDVQTCRICLTQGSKMNNMDLSLPLRDIEDAPLIFEALEEIMGEKILVKEGYSSSICAMCLGLLKIAYDLKEQYYKSKQSFNLSDSIPLHKVLYLSDRSPLSKNSYSKNGYNKLVNVAVQTEQTFNFREAEIKKMLLKHTKMMKINKMVNVTVQTDQTYLKTAEIQRKTGLPNVELVSGDNSYDFKDLVIVENPPDDKDNDVFHGFLQNLGSVISASYAGKYAHQKETSERSQNHAELEITPLSKDTFDFDVFGPLETINSDPLKMSYTCRHCKKSYGSASYVKKHMPICEKFHNMQCYICNEWKQNLNELIFHVRQKHAVALNLDHPLIDKYMRALICKICGKVSASRGGLMYHLKQHKGKQFACEQCGKTFLFEYKLNCHKRHKHNKRETVEICPICGKTFHYKSGVISHMQLHKQDYKYSCSFCGKKFLYQYSKTTHERIHTGEKPYSCRYCNRPFRRYSERQAHEKSVHTGERPYKCHICKAGFVTTFNRKVHMLQHKGPFECYICNKGFVNSDILKYHLKRIHKITEDIEQGEHDEDTAQESQENEQQAEEQVNENYFSE